MIGKLGSGVVAAEHYISDKVFARGMHMISPFWCCCLLAVHLPGFARLSL